MASIEDGMRERGVDFRLTVAIEGILRLSGATDEFLRAFRGLLAPVTVTSDPPGATVSIDGQQRGQTPLEMRLPPGTVRLATTVEGYLEAQDTLTTAPAVAETVHVVLIAEPEPALAGETAAANLDVQSQPPGATVTVDGEQRGETPMSLTLDPGAYEVAISRDGYLENRQSVNLEAGIAETLSVTLTSTEAAQPVVEGGGSNLKVILPIVGGAAGAVAAFLLAGPTEVTTAPTSTTTPTILPTTTNRPPVGGSISASPLRGFVFDTEFRFTANGVSDPDGDNITYLWQYGDGSLNPPSARSVTKVYSQARAFTVTLSVNDGRSQTRFVDSVTVTVDPDVLPGLWDGSYSWNCGAGRFGGTGTTQIAFVIDASRVVTAEFNRYSGFATYLGGTSRIQVDRFIEGDRNSIRITIGGSPGPGGPENGGDPGHFRNSFIGVLNGFSIEGTTLFGEASAGGGCGQSTEPSGFFAIQKR